MGKKQEYKLRNEEFLHNISKKDSIKTLPHGIFYEIIKEGSGEGTVQPRSIVICNYRGSLISGQVFDDSWQKPTPEAFRIKVIGANVIG